MEQDRAVSATEAREIIEKRIGLKLSQSKMTRLMEAGIIPSRRSVLDARKRMILVSDLEKWIEQARQEMEREEEEKRAPLVA